MKYEDYMVLIKRRLKNYNISNNTEQYGVKVNLYAYSKFLSKEIGKNLMPFNKYNISERIYLKHFTILNNEEIKEYIEFLYNIAIENPSKNSHIQNMIIGVIICDSIDEETKKLIQTFHYTKPFYGYIKGWSEIQLICIDLENNTINFNNEAKFISEMFLFS